MSPMRCSLALSLLFAGSTVYAAPNCVVKLTGNDMMQFDLKSVTVSASCPRITLELAHVGKLPVAAMGHNVVISATKDVADLANAALKAGAAGGYVPKPDPRVLAATPMVGGGSTSRGGFAGKSLAAGGDYTFFCSFPGHSALMKGVLVVTK